MKHLCLLLSTLSLTAFATPSQATDAEFQQLLLSRQPGALEALARDRLARDPLDEAALWYWGYQAADEPRTRAELMPRAQVCVRDKPQSARCQHLLGVLIGAELMDTGGFSAMRRIGEVRAQFERGVALAPNDYAMRRDLLGFYLDVPALMGGSGRKAREQAEPFARVDAARGVLLHALLAISDKCLRPGRAAPGRRAAGRRAPARQRLAVGTKTAPRRSPLTAGCSPTPRAPPPPTRRASG